MISPKEKWLGLSQTFVAIAPPIDYSQISTCRGYHTQDAQGTSCVVLMGKYWKILPI